MQASGRLSQLGTDGCRCSALRGSSKRRTGLGNGSEITEATLMLVQGVHPKMAQEHLGHSSIQMTLNLYSHLSESLGKQVAETLAEAIGE